MGKQRLEQFTDGVLAIILTITALEISAPEGTTWAALEAEAPILLVYALSFTNVAIFWNNHHHMLHATDRIDGYVLWANMLLLFWLSLIPLLIHWMNDTHIAALPTAAYGVNLALAEIAYVLLELAIIRCNGPESRLAIAVGKDKKGKLSMAIYLMAVPLAFLHPWLSLALYVFIAAIWFIPDRRIESTL